MSSLVIWRRTGALFFTILMSLGSHKRVPLLRDSNSTCYKNVILNASLRTSLNLYYPFFCERLQCRLYIYTSITFPSKLSPYDNLPLIQLSVTPEKIIRDEPESRFTVTFTVFYLQFFCESSIYFFIKNKIEFPRSQVTM